MSQPVARSAPWHKVLGLLSSFLVHERLLAGAARPGEIQTPETAVAPLVQARPGSALRRSDAHSWRQAESFKGFW